LVFESDSSITPKIVPAASIAVCQACRALLKNNDVYVKWPNDIYVESKKICGMMVDADSIGGKNIYSLGIGINVNEDMHDSQPDNLGICKGSLFDFYGNIINREDLLSSFCNNFEALLLSEMPVIKNIYQELSLFREGDKIYVYPKKRESNDDYKEGMVLGFDEQCRLRVRYQKEEVILNSDEVSVRKV